VSGSVLLQKVWDTVSDRDQGISRLELVTELSIFVSATGEAMLPQHRQTWTIQGGRLPNLDLPNVSVRGPFRLGRYTRDGLRAREDAGYIDVLEHSGLVVHGSGVITAHVTVEVDHQQARELEDAATLELHIDLPVDRSNRSSRLRAKFSYVTGSTQHEPTSTYQQTLARFAPSPAD